MEMSPVEFSKPIFDLYLLEGEKAIRDIYLRGILICSVKIPEIQDEQSLFKFLKHEVISESLKIIEN